MKVRAHLTAAHVMMALGVLQQVSWNVKSAEVWQSQELNCAISLPNDPGWARVTPPVEMLKVMVRNQAQAKSISLYVFDAPRNGQDLQSFIPGFKKSWYGDVVSSGQNESDAKLDGRPAHRLADTVDIQGRQLHRIITITIENNKVYEVASMSGKGDPLSDADILATINSFHFLGNSSAPASQRSPQDPGAGMADAVGKVTAYVLIGIVVVFGVFKAGSGKRSKC